MSALPSGVVNIRGKQYETVALRVHKFREAYPEHALTTDVLHRDVDCVVVRCTISNPEGRVMATGHAEEYRKSSDINKTSALENCETSAIGRALAAFGLGGTEFASADEVARAVTGQKGEAKKPEPISPRKLAWDAVGPEAQQTLGVLAVQVEDAMRDSGAEAAMDAIDWADLSTEEKAALAYRLTPATTRALRTLSEQRHKAAA